MWAVDASTGGDRRCPRHAKPKPDRRSLHGLDIGVAVDIFWRNPSGGTFSSTGNWFGGVVPGTSDVARFSLTAPLAVPQTYTVSFNLAATNQRLVVEDDRVTFDLNGRVYRTPTSGNQIGTVGQTGRLTLLDGLWDDTGTGSLDLGINGASGVLTISTGGQFLRKQNLFTRRSVHPFVWDWHHGMGGLSELLISQFALGSELAEWKLGAVEGMSADGRALIGTGVNPDSNTQAGLLKLDSPINVPEPSSVVLAVVLMGMSTEARLERLGTI